MRPGFVALVLLLAAGCRHAVLPIRESVRPASEAVVTEPLTAPENRDGLPVTLPVPIDWEGADSVAVTTPPATGHWAKSFRGLTEESCRLLAARHAVVADLLTAEVRRGESGTRHLLACRNVLACGNADRLDERMAADLLADLRSYAAVEARNRAVAEALGRYFRLVEVEVRSQLLREAMAVGDELLMRAKAARDADVRPPVEVEELERLRSVRVSRVEELQTGSRLLNIDLKRRLGLPARPEDEALWPLGNFRVVEMPMTCEELVEAALQDRPELLGLRKLYYGLMPGVLPEVRNLFGAIDPRLGWTRTLPIRSGFGRLVHSAYRSEVEEAAREVEYWRSQLVRLIAEREREVADEVRAAYLELRSRSVQAGLARERVGNWESRLRAAGKKKAADQPGAEWAEPQVRFEWLNARAEWIAEVVAWHQARVRLEHATGRLVLPVVSAR